MICCGIYSIDSAAEVYEITYLTASLVEYVLSVRHATDKIPQNGYVDMILFVLIFA